MDYFNKKNKNPFEWKAILEGIQGFIYEDGFFMIKILFNTNYRESTLLNKIFNPHVNSFGFACIVPCKNDIISVLETVEKMLLDYDAEVVHSYGEEPIENPDKYVEKEKEWMK